MCFPSSPLCHPPCVCFTLCPPHGLKMVSAVPISSTSWGKKWRKWRKQCREKKRGHLFLCLLLKSEEDFLKKNTKRSPIGTRMDPCSLARGRDSQDWSRPVLSNTVATGHMWLYLKLKYNSHAVKFTLLRCVSPWVFIYSQGCATITTIYFQNIFIIL